jgi:asparagine synthase (glutamine-hydrolysing)
VAPSEGHLKEELRDLLLESVQLRLVADVPVGAFLSGGIDSSLVVALLQRHTSQQLKTFTIGMPDAQYNEAQHAQAIAQHLGTDHHTLYCTEDDFKSLLPLLPQIYDEPMGDSSAIPTLLVSRLAKEQVKVSLSADGGDELFGGYTKYEITQRLYPKIAWMPKPLRQLMSGMVGWLQADWIEDWSPRLPLLKGYKNLNNKLPKLRQALQAPSLQGFFHAASSYINHEDLAALHGSVQSRYEAELPLIPGYLLSMLGLMDVQTYLEGDILCKVDRATMYHALEGREPLLDHKLLEFALALPDRYKIHQGKTKYLLRSILYDELPPSLLERPKQGFSIPIETWLRGILRPELEAIAQDRAFAEALGLDLGHLTARLLAFFKGDKRVHPQWVWFMHQLWAWWRQWAVAL